MSIVQVASVAVFILLASVIPVRGQNSPDHDLALQWPQGENVCSGFWIYHPYSKVRHPCRDASHGYEHPIEKHEVLAFETSGAGIRSCEFAAGNWTAFHDRPEGRSLEALQQQWTNVDTSHLRAEDEPGKRDGFTWVRCYATVWNTPPFALKVSNACRIEEDRSHFNSKKLLSGADGGLDSITLDHPDPGEFSNVRGPYDGKGFEHWYDVNGKSRIVGCSTGDQMPTSVPDQRRAKIKFEIETLSCPVRLFRFDKKTVDSSQCNVNWDDEISRDHIRALAALRSLVYATFYLHELRSRYSSSFDQSDLSSADKYIALYKKKLPQIIKIFQLDFSQIPERYQLPGLLSVLVNLD